MQLIVGYNDNNLFKFFSISLKKHSDISVDTKILGKPFRKIKSLNQLKSKIHAFHPYVTLQPLEKIVKHPLFKNREDVYLLFNNGEWFVYDMDWQTFFYLNQFFTNK